MGSCQRAAAPDAELPEIGADWAVVQEYLDQERAWQKDSQERYSKGAQEGKSPREMREGLPKPPDVEPALAAATAILNMGGAHDKTIEAAEFLVRRHAYQESGRYFYIGAKALLAYAPDYQKWPRVLSEIYYSQTPYGAQVAKFFEEMASDAEDPALRANGKYYVAAGMMRAANEQFVLPSEDREVLRQRAIDAATGLSVGVEEEKFLGLHRDRTATPRTLAEAEADLLRSLRHGSVGAMLPEVTGKRLDGREERLSDYRGRIVLLDFWATWCGPCVADFPKLRELVAKLPADRFALVSISGDEELDTVTRFIEDKPMPWTNWHAGRGSDLERLLRIEGYPSYVLVGEGGKILARLPSLIPPFASLIEKAVHRLGEFGSTEGLDVESMDLSSLLRDPDTWGGRTGAMSSSFYRMAVVSGAMAVLCLFIGLRGLLTRRPFLLPARWLFVFLMAVFFGPVVSLIPFAWPSQAMDWLPFVMFPVMAVFFWVQMKGYLAFAVTGKSFRDGLLVALDKLQLPYEESLSSIRLTSVEADLQVAVQSWIGTGQIKVRPGRHGPLLKRIVQTMKDYFRTATVETNMIFCIFFLILGIFSILMAMAALFHRSLL